MRQACKQGTFKVQQKGSYFQVFKCKACITSRIRTNEKTRKNGSATSCQEISSRDPEETGRDEHGDTRGELEIAKLEEENAKAKRIAEKEMEIARAEGSRASTSLRSISLIPIHSDPFEKVPSWLDEFRCDEKTTKIEKRYPESHWPTNLSHHNLTLCHTQFKCPTWLRKRCSRPW